jgi:hypothetical protein
VHVPVATVQLLLQELTATRRLLVVVPSTVSALLALGGDRQGEAGRVEGAACGEGDVALDGVAGGDRADRLSEADAVVGEGEPERARGGGGRCRARGTRGERGPRAGARH